MTNMVERVALAMWRQRVIYAGKSGIDLSGDDELVAIVFNGVVDEARAAIRAMREPNVEIMGAFWRQKNCGTQVIGHRGKDTDDYSAWRAAIDAALGEEVSK